MQTKKHLESEFVCTQYINMQKHPELIHWTQNGTEMHLSDIDKICEIVLPEYFRHSNFNSFIRQLSMYSFHKTKKVNRSITFKNQIFRRGNENNFFLIQRKRKFRDLQNFQERFEKECEDLISRIRQKTKITPEMRETLLALFEYQCISQENLRRMKCQIQAIYKQLKDSRNKKVQEICKELRSNLTTSISQLNSEAKKIDEYIMSSLFRQSEGAKQSLQPISNDRIHNHNVEQGSTTDAYKTRYVARQNQGPPNIEIKENMISFNSFPVFLEEFKTRKQQISFQQKLYNPFNSQSSFLFLPNYVGVSSQIPLDGRYNSVFQYKIDSNPHLPEKDPTFDDYQESASMSFVNDIEDKLHDDFPQKIQPLLN